MKEVMAIIRRDKVPATRAALDELGFSGMTIYSVEGRGKQKGLIQEFDPEVPSELDTGVRLVETPSVYAREHPLTKVVRFIPKRMLRVVVPDEAVGRVVEALIRVNQTGYPGDGRIFVLPVEEAVRVRTGERGAAAIG